MRVLLAIVARERLFGRRKITAAWLRDVDRQTRPLLPWGNAETHYECWLAHTGFTAMSLWTNEPAPQQPQGLLQVTPQAVMGSSGYTSLSAQQSLRHQNMQLTEKGCGVFALLLADAQGLCARTSASGAEPLYYTTTRDYVFVGTRAALVHVISRAGAEPTYRLDGCASFIQGGYVIGERMLFENTNAVPPNTSLTVTRRTVRVQRVANSPRDPTPAAPVVGKQLAEALVETCHPLLQRTGPVRCAITGGRDSRLVLAALKAAGVDVLAHTHGFAEHPDVKIGKEIAELLGIPHLHSVPANQAEAIALDPLQRALHTIILGDGMLSAYENIATTRTWDHSWSDEPAFGGHGGGLYQGGYGRALDDVTSDTAAAFLAKKFLRHESIVQKGHYQQHKAVMRYWIDRARLEPELALDGFFLRYRVGRWSSAARSAYSVTRNLIQPYFDERVMQAGRAGSVSDRLSERVFFTALQTLHKPLATYPFAGPSWRFQRQGGPGHDVETSANKSLPPFNWRLHSGMELQQFCADYILSHDIVAEFLDLNAVTALLRGPQPMRRHLLWHLFTLTALLSNDWFRKPERPRRPIVIPLPT